MNLTSYERDEPPSGVRGRAARGRGAGRRSPGERDRRPRPAGRALRAPPRTSSNSKTTRPTSSLRIASPPPSSARPSPATRNDAPRDISSPGFIHLLCAFAPLRESSSYTRQRTLTQRRKGAKRGAEAQRVLDKRAAAAHNLCRPRRPLSRNRRMAHTPEIQDREQEVFLQRLTHMAEAMGTAREFVTLWRALRVFAEAHVPCIGIFISLYDPERDARTAVYAYGDGEELDVSTLPPMPVSVRGAEQPRGAHRAGRHHERLLEHEAARQGADRHPRRPGQRAAPAVVSGRPDDDDGARRRHRRGAVVRERSLPPRARDGDADGGEPRGRRRREHASAGARALGAHVGRGVEPTQGRIPRHAFARAADALDGHPRVGRGCCAPADSTRRRPPAPSRSSSATRTSRSRSSTTSSTCRASSRASCSSTRGRPTSRPWRARPSRRCARRPTPSGSCSKPTSRRAPASCSATPTASSRSSGTFWPTP